MATKTRFLTKSFAHAMAVTLCVFVAGGCTTFNGKLVSRTPADSATSQSASAPSDLPAEKSATICLTAAREMDAKGLHADAINQYERARQFDPRLGAQVAPRLAVLHDRLGNEQRALAEYKQALQAHASDPALLNDYGYFCYERGQLEEAEQYFREALKKNPEYRRAWVNLAVVLVQQGRENEGMGAFSKVLSPEEAYTNLGVLLAKQGKREESRQALHRALELVPNLRHAQQLLAHLDRQVD